MRQLAIVAAVCTAISGLTAPALSGDGIDAGLEEVFANSERGEVISALVYLWEQADISALTAALDAERASLPRRHEEVVRTLRDTAELTQAALRQDLTQMRAAGEVEHFEPYWIANIVRVDATEEVLREIAARPEVERVFYNIRVELVAPVDGLEAPGVDERIAAQKAADRRGGDATPISTVTPGVHAVRAPEVWAMGYTGQGVLIGTIDTGVNGNHEALASRWRGLDPQYAGNPGWAWLDPTGNTSSPLQFTSGSSHGTHVTGTVVGGAPGEQIGVAPGAQWIHAAALQGSISQQISRLIESFQWMANPTGTPGDSWAVPRVCSNSWGTTSSMGHPNCDQTFWQWIDNSEAAGTAHFFSAGNEGSSGLRRPADRATNEYYSSAVAAINPHNSSWPIASFSSRGPTSCTPDGSTAIKPDISGPGVDTRSAMVGGGYGNMSGTSMASPHINGVAALMLEACDVLTSDEIKQIIYDTAVDLGTPGKDNTYGWGMVDAVEAVNMALAQCTLGLKVPQGVPNMFDPGVAETFLVEVVEGSENVLPGSEKLFYRFDGGSYTSVALTPLGDGFYEATIPGPGCDDLVEFYVQVEGDGGSVRTSPTHAPQSVYTGLVGEFVTDTLFEQNFADGLPSGWSQDGLWNVTSACAVAGDCPSAQWAYYGIPAQCNYVTGSSANSGEMLSAPIVVPEIPEGGVAEVRFCYTLQTEASQSYDKARFSVVGGTVIELTDSASQWSTFSMDITQYAGQTITLRWHFDTIDGILNDYRGWQVDNVRVEVTSLQCEDVGVCEADINGDGVVDASDLLELLGAWGECGGCDADLNGDGVVDVSDLLELLGAWGDCG